MKRNSFFAAVAFAMVTLFAGNTTAQAQGHGHISTGRGYNVEFNNGRRTSTEERNFNNGRRTSTDERNFNNRSARYNGAARTYNEINRETAYRDGVRRTEVMYTNRGHRDGYVQMHGHDWDGDGFMVGYNGRVRHFDDGRWGYFRDGAWIYYDRFYEPDYYFATPVHTFRDHVMTKEEKTAVGVAVGVVAVAALIDALAH